MPASRNYIDKTAIIGGHPQHFKGYEHEHAPVIGNPVWIGPYTTVDSGTARATTVGDGTMIMGHCNIGHDAIIGEGCDIADSVVICGTVEIGNHVRIGVNATILPFKKLGDYSRVGAGAVVIDDVPAYACVVGNPAKIIYYFCRLCGTNRAVHIQKVGSPFRIGEPQYCEQCHG